MDSSDTRAELGRNIKAARIRAGMTQAQLADALDVSQQMVPRYEKGSVSLSTEKLEMIASVLKADFTMPIGASRKSKARSIEERGRVLSGIEIDLLHEFGKIKTLTRKRLSLQVVRAIALADEVENKDPGT